MTNKIQVNAEAVRELRDYIKSHYKTDGFNMGHSIVDPTCDTAFCIGGFAACKWPSIRLSIDGLPKTKSQTFGFIDKLMAKKLGISEDTQWELCYPGHYASKTLPVALKVLTHLAKTGKVDWERFE